MTMFNGVIRNAVAFWIPTFLAQYLSIPTDQVAVVSSILPLINIAGTFASVWALRFTKDNEKKLTGIFFVLAALLFGVIARRGGICLSLSISSFGTWNN